MELQVGGRAPYAPGKTIIALLEKQRAVGLPKIDKLRLSQQGVSESLVPRTLASLVTLGFIAEDGGLTPEFDRLRRLSLDPPRRFLRCAEPD